ncbi:mucoidy inhibitor MuiA family protein [Candidatus Thorarchaeota archaeon]|nr:MAG: mucoidy inhibitor MuiA family protein [Candidatus Thorarchaeota archaeon]
MKDIKSTITNATIFRDGARIIRVGKTELGAGEQIVRIGGITEYAQHDSFRVKGSGKAILRGIDLKKTTRTYEPEGDIKEEIEKLKKLEKEKRSLQDQFELEQQRIAHLNTIMSQFSSEFGKWFSAGETGMENLTNMDKTNQDLMMDAKKKLRNLGQEIERIDAEISALRTNIQQIQGERRTETFTEVFVTLDVKESTTIELEVTYQISSANWYPTYDIDIGEGITSLKRIAVIYNNTLEDWEDISLVVSTASARPVEAVQPQPYYVDTYRPITSSLGHGAPGGGDYKAYASLAKDEVEESIDDLSGIMMKPQPEMIQEYATSGESLGGITIYEVPGKVTIASESNPHPITLTSDDFESRRLHYWNASAMTEVVAQDEITNGDSIILPGNVKVYAAGDYIGETQVDSIAPREKFRLGTRAAYDIKAEKKLVEKDTEKAGITKGKQKRGYKYELELKNFSKKDVEIRVVDRIPYSNSEKITIELSEPTIPYKSYELGIITWEAKIAPDKELKIEYSYEVEWEKDLIIRPSLP